MPVDEKEKIVPCMKRHVGVHFLQALLKKEKHVQKVFFAWITSIIRLKDRLSLIEFDTNLLNLLNQ